MKALDSMIWKAKQHSGARGRPTTYVNCYSSAGQRVRRSLHQCLAGPAWGTQNWRNKTQFKAMVRESNGWPLIMVRLGLGARTTRLARILFWVSRIDSLRRAPEAARPRASCWSAWALCWSRASGHTCGPPISGLVVCLQAHPGRRALVIVRCWPGGLLVARPRQRQCHTRPASKFRCGRAPRQMVARRGAGMNNLAPLARANLLGGAHLRTCALAPGQRPAGAQWRARAGPTASMHFAKMHSRARAPPDSRHCFINYHRKLRPR